VSFPAFFDTNVLYGALLNDFLLELADRRLFRPLWSNDVLIELSKNLVENGERPDLVEKRIRTMERYFPDAMVTGYDALVSSMTNDRKDRHVSPPPSAVEPRCWSPSTSRTFLLIRSSRSISR